MWMSGNWQHGVRNGEDHWMGRPDRHMRQRDFSERWQRHLTSRSRQRREGHTASKLNVCARRASPSAFGEITRTRRCNMKTKLLIGASVAALILGGHTVYTSMRVSRLEREIHALQRERLERLNQGAQ